MHSNEHVSEDAIREVMPDPVPPGTLLFSFKLSIGKMGVAGVPLYTNEAIAALPIRRQDLLDRDYLHYALRSQSFEDGANHAVLGKLLNKKKLASIQITFPPLVEQRRIVDVLTRAESIVRLRRDAFDKAAALIPALFLQCFGDPAMNPKEWPIEGLAAVGSLDRGKSRHRPRDAKELYGGVHPFIQTGDVANSNGRITDFSTTYSDVGLAQSKLWPKGTLCITIAANIAKTGVLAFDACFPDSVVGFLPGKRIRTAYVQAWLAFLQPALEANAPQAAQKNINLEILRSLPVPVPPLELQDTFESRCRSVQSIIGQAEAAMKKAEELFHSLLHRAFRGEL